VAIFAVSRVMTSFPTSSSTGIGPIFVINESNQIVSWFWIIDAPNIATITGNIILSKSSAHIIFFPVEVATNRVFNFSMLLVLVESCNLYKETLITSSFSNKCCYKFFNVEHISGPIKNILVDFKYVQMMHWQPLAKKWCHVHTSNPQLSWKSGC